jgi:DNA-directed RNA polymerase alpha subunit
MTATAHIEQDFDNDLWALELSVRVNNCLRAEGIFSRSTLLTYSEEELYRLPNFGRTSQREVVEALAKQGFKLRDDHSPSPSRRFVQIEHHLDQAERSFTLAREELLQAMKEFSKIEHALKEWRKP